MRNLLNPAGVPEFEACATTGEGIFETLKCVAKLVLTDDLVAAAERMRTVASEGTE
jgi:hypothetical protein